MNEVTTPQAEVKKSDSFNVAVMRLAERVDGKNTFTKFLEYGLPTLDQVLEGAPAPDSWAEETVKEGEQEAVINTPVYNSAQLDYLQTALTQRVQGIARSRDKAGMDPATNWTELLETSGGTKYPVQLKEFKAGLAEFLSEAGELTANQIAAVLVYTDTRRLQEADDHRKERVAHWFGKYIEAMGDAASEVASVVANINRALEYSPEDIDF